MWPPMNENVVYGRNAVEEALRRPERVNRILLAKESRAGWAEAVIETARAAHVRFDFVPQGQLNRMTGTHEHQGVAAVVSPLAYTSLDECLAGCGQQAALLALDEVRNPRNVGMVVRSALGAGARGVLLPGRKGALLDEHVVRASAGAVFHMPVVNCGNLKQALRSAKEAGFWVYGLDMHGAQSVFEVDWPERVLLVVGNETTGVRPSVRKAYDGMVRIPLAGNLDSLNVAVAAAVALFEVRAQRLREAKE